MAILGPTFEVLGASGQLLGELVGQLEDFWEFLGYLLDFGKLLTNFCTDFWHFVSWWQTLGPTLSPERVGDDGTATTATADARRIRKAV